MRAVAAEAPAIRSGDGKSLKTRTFIELAHTGIEEASGSPLLDGSTLAKGCLAKLEALRDPDQFPPRLFILLASPAYAENGRAAQLLAGVVQTLTAKGLGHVPLIGGSSAAVLFDRRPHDKGALLVCLASRHVEVRAAMEADVAADPSAAVASLVQKLDPRIEQGDEPNRDNNRTLIVFLPSAQLDCIPSHVHRLLAQETLYRIPIEGGVSSVIDAQRQKPGLQFFGYSATAGSVVAALIESDCPLAPSLCRGYERSERNFHVNAGSKPVIEISEFLEGPIPENLDDGRGFVLLGETSPDSNQVASIFTVKFEGGTLHLPRGVSGGQRMEVLRPALDRGLEVFRNSVQQAMRRVHADNPIACLSFRCASHQRHREKTGADIERDLASYERETGFSLVGGLFDGEAGVDQTGDMVCTNWSWSNLAIADELTDAAIRRLGSSAIAQSGPKLDGTKRLRDTLEVAVEMVHEAGYPGAMLSLVLPQDQNNWIIAQSASGLRFKRIVEETRRRLEEPDILAEVVRTGRYCYVRESARDTRCNQAAVEESKLISQAVLPILDADGGGLGALQIDLGDARHLKDVRPVSYEVMKLLSSAIAIAVRRVIGTEEVRITAALDGALQESLALSATLEDGLQKFLVKAAHAFGVDRGHIRLFDEQTNMLRLVAGMGPYFEAAKGIREEIDSTDPSRSGRTFVQGTATILNEAADDQATKDLADRHPELRESLGWVHSCATAVYFDKNGKKMGTVTLHAHQKWFFCLYHARCLLKLTQRLAFLIEHLSKVREADEAIRGLKFLIDAVPGPTARGDLTNRAAELQQMTRKCREAARAEVVSLYLWEEAIETFVLSAESGWKDSRWIGASRFKSGERWTGSVARDNRPRYFPNFAKYLKDTNRDLDPVQAKAMLGISEPQDVRLEAISMPLRVGQHQLGILTLLRSGEADRSPSGFSTTDITTLTEAADRLSAHVEALLSSQQAQALRVAKEKRSTVQALFSDALRANDAVPSPDVLCQSLQKHLSALSAYFYFDGEQESNREELACIGYAAEDASPADARVMEVYRVGRLYCERRRIKLEDAEKPAPSILATEGCVVRACVPVTVGDRTRGVLDVHWAEVWKYWDCPVTSAVLSQLEGLGTEVGEEYLENLRQRRRAAEQVKRHRQNLALNAGSAMVFQYAHRLTNLLQEINGLADQLRTQEQDNRAMQRIAQVLELGADVVERPLHVAERVAQQQQQQINLYRTIQAVLKKCRRSKPAKCEVSVTVPLELTAFADEECVREAIRNIVENAFRAVRDSKDRGSLTITAYRDDKKGEVHVVLVDIGIGMTGEEVKAALDGFFSTRKSKGVGVLISKVLLEAHGGKLAIESQKGAGTKVTVTLPVGGTEEEQ